MSLGMMARGQYATYLPTGELCKLVDCVNAGYDGWLYTLQSEVDGRRIERVNFSQLKRKPADVVQLNCGGTNV